MWSVKVSISSECFIDKMEEIGVWLAAEGIDTSHFSCAREAGGSVRLRISFRAADEAGRFAHRFAGAVTTADCVLPT